MDFEVYAITDVTGHAAGGDTEQRFLPLYYASTVDADADHNAVSAIRRELRRPSSTQSGGSDRPTPGPKCRVEAGRPEGRLAGDLRQLTIQTLCTNRDLVLQVPFGAGATDFTLDITAPVKSIRTVKARVVRWRRWPTAPSRGGPSIICRSITFTANTTAEQGAASCATASSCMGSPSAHLAERRQVEAVRTMQVRP